MTSIFYNGPYEWDLRSSAGLEKQIGDLQERNFLDRIWRPGISVSMSGNSFKISRLGIGNIPMSGNSFAHVFVGRIGRNDLNTVVRGYFRLNAIVFGFTLFWLSGVYLISGAIIVESVLAYLRDGGITKLWMATFGIAFPILGTLVLLSFRALARYNEREIIGGLTSKLGEPTVKPDL